MRYQSAADLRTDLRRLRRETESGRQTGKVKSAGGNASTVRLPMRTIAYGGLLVVTLVAIGLSIRWYRASQKPPKPPITERQITANAEDDPIEGGLISHDGNYAFIVDSKFNASLLDIDSGELRQIPGPASPVDWFPDGAHVLVSRPKPPSLWKLSIVDQSWKKIADGSFDVAALSRDGTRIVFPRGQGLWVMNSNGADAHRIAELNGAEAVSVAWSPTGRRIAYYGIKDPRISNTPFVAVCDPSGAGCEELVRGEYAPNG